MLKSYWKDPVWSAVIAAGVVAAAGAIGTYLLDWWPTIGKALAEVIDFVLDRSSIPNWLIGVMAICTLLILLVLVGAAWNAIRPSRKANLTWLTYTSDSFFGVRWRWKYINNAVGELTTFCPNCDYQVFPEDASAYSAIDRIAFRCDSCQRELATFNESYSALKSKVERFIHQKIRNGTWNSHVGT